MKTKDLTSVQLQQYFAEHVRYEMQMMLNATFAILRQFEIRKGLENMPVESFVIHLRNLINFLYPNKIQDTDVCAKDFFIMEGMWEEVRPPISELLRKAKIRADKEVGHLTTSRQSGISKDKVWNVKSLVAELMPIIDTFSKTADKVQIDELMPPVMRYYHTILSE